MRCNWVILMCMYRSGTRSLRGDISSWWWACSPSTLAWYTMTVSQSPLTSLVLDGVWRPCSERRCGSKYLNKQAQKCISDIFTFRKLNDKPIVRVLFVPDRLDDVHGNSFLTLDPNVTGVFNGPYPLGIDPVSREYWRLLLLIVDLKIIWRASIIPTIKVKNTLKCIMSQGHVHLVTQANIVYFCAFPFPFKNKTKQQLYCKNVKVNINWHVLT